MGHRQRSTVRLVREAGSAARGPDRYYPASRLDRRRSDRHGRQKRAAVPPDRSRDSSPWPSLPLRPVVRHSTSIATHRTSGKITEPRETVAARYARALVSPVAGRSFGRVPLANARFRSDTCAAKTASYATTEPAALRRLTLTLRVLVAALRAPRRWPAGSPTLAARSYRTRETLQRRHGAPSVRRPASAAART